MCLKYIHDSFTFNVKDTQTSSNFCSLLFITLFALNWLDRCFLFPVFILFHFFLCSFSFHAHMFVIFLCMSFIENILDVTIHVSTLETEIFLRSRESQFIGGGKFDALLKAMFSKRFEMMMIHVTFTTSDSHLNRLNDP